MTSDERRRSLHDRLDQILDESSRIGGWSRPTSLAEIVVQSACEAGLSWEARRKARELISEVASLASDVVGQSVISVGLPRVYARDGEQRELLREWLSILYPLLEPPVLPSGARAEGKHELSIFDVMNALSALDAGEVQPIFVPRKGKNRRANRWSLGRAKLEALVWKKRLRSLGYAEKAANHEITIAFGEQWDTVRKWKTQCEQILGESHVYAALIMAGSAMDRYVKRKQGVFGAPALNPMKGLQEAGEKYRSEVLRSAELSKRKRSTAA
jgi:hypothetical protein